MKPENLTLGQTVSELQRRLAEYIEAAYHIRNRDLVAQRRQLLEEPGTVHQIPFVESTPRYVVGKKLSEMNLHPEVLGLLESLAEVNETGSRIVYDPPYEHQAEAIEAAIVEGRNLVVTTGTGSGKTECFLLPLLASLAREAAEQPDSFAVPSVRVILLYPMNALVNDQLGRLRLMLGDKRVSSFFREKAGRPARFARYTSRTPYPGVRNRAKDQRRLKPINEFYVGLLNRSESSNDEEATVARRLIGELTQRGKWPAKSDIRKWYGVPGARWQDAATGEFLRCVMQQDDVELLTRHEVLASAPDVLVTNYSMLEYMLMRPIEAPVFDATGGWLAANPTRRLLLVVDEAHLYKGAAGSEVALLLRRLRMRLGLDAERVQAICTSASFREPSHSREFASQLTGLRPETFSVVIGQLQRKPQSPGSLSDAEALGMLDLASFYRADTEAARMGLIRPFLEYRGTKAGESVGPSILQALDGFAPLGLLTNATMGTALPVDSLGNLVFPGVDADLADRAVTNMMGLASLAREKPGQPSLLPCRVHSFHRGLPGLWLCMDPACSGLDAQNGRVGGKLYSQPRNFCDSCGARVLELYTCRVCGTAYAKAYTDTPPDPEYLWSEPGASLSVLGGEVEGLQPVDILLEDAPESSDVRLVVYDLLTGRIDPEVLGPRTRNVFIPGQVSNRKNDFGQQAEAREFRSCPICDAQRFGRSRIEDHQTSGDEPFQALLAKQIEVQPPSAKKATPAAPLRGRKVLVFSDSRQAAARLAPNLQRYATKDAVRPLVAKGYSLALSELSTELSLDDAYFAVLLSSAAMDVVIDPEVTEGAAFSEDLRRVNEALGAGALTDPELFQDLRTQVAHHAAPPDLIRSIHSCLSDPLYGLQSLALASVKEHKRHAVVADSLPAIPGFADSTDFKRALLRAWLSSWKQRGYWLASMPREWWEAKQEVEGHATGDFRNMQRLLGKEGSEVFRKQWLPLLLRKFCEKQGSSYRASGAQMGLDLADGWGYCGACRNVQRVLPGSSRCVNCGREKVTLVDPNTDEVFLARKSYYREPTIRALRDGVAPICLRAEEHTAQLNSVGPDKAFSRAEEYELLFQDINMQVGDEAPSRAVDVLSCTTTMEVGIDIGSLSGVSLRNMPPGRTNYQQRSGRAGRRGEAVATVTAFGSSDSHDEHYFSHPAEMISGDVEDPELVLDNAYIARRHMVAFLLQRFLRDTVKPDEAEKRPHLFSVLGTIDEFLNPKSTFSRARLEAWLDRNQAELRNEIDSWLPTELAGDDRAELLGTFPSHTLGAIDDALAGMATHPIDEARTGESANGTEEEDDADGNKDPGELELPPEEGTETRRSQQKSRYLLDRLLYKGVLPRYAFPTDVATFYVFDLEASSYPFVEYRYAPQQGMSIALSQYAPGKSVWIDGKLWTSGALYSPMADDLSDAWAERELYFECPRCGYAMTRKASQQEKGLTLHCPGCQAHSLGPARYWMTPPGFAHPCEEAPEASRDELPPLGYPTRAKLTVITPTEPEQWTNVGDRTRFHHGKHRLIVTNHGPGRKGYDYCVWCGRIEPSSLPGKLTGNDHRKPYPDERQPVCSGGAVARGIVLGTDFFSDVLLVSLRVDEPVNLIPGLYATNVALRTVCESLSKAACDLLEIEPGELIAEFRPALTPLGATGKEAEVYLYDSLSGGAGFARAAGRLGSALLERALELLEVCPEKCDTSCYRCLRSYKNKYEHSNLDRHMGASLLHYVLRGRLPDAHIQRIDQAADILFAELSGRELPGVALRRNVVQDIPGIGAVQIPILCQTASSHEYAICVSGALTPDWPPTQGLRDLREYATSIVLLPPVDEASIRINLPQASAVVCRALGA